jgi:hypothetical protein
MRAVKLQNVKYVLKAISLFMEAVKKTWLAVILLLIVVGMIRLDQAYAQAKAMCPVPAGGATPQDVLASDYGVLEVSTPSNTVGGVTSVEVSIVSCSGPFYIERLQVQLSGPALKSDIIVIGGTVDSNLGAIGSGGLGSLSECSQLRQPLIPAGSFYGEVMSLCPAQIKVGDPIGNLALQAQAGEVDIYLGFRNGGAFGSTNTITVFASLLVPDGDRVSLYTTPPGAS